MPAASTRRRPAKRTHEAIDMRTWMVDAIRKAQR